MKRTRHRARLKTPKVDIPEQGMHLVFVTGSQHGTSTGLECVNHWVEQVETSQGCQMSCVDHNAMSWLQGRFNGCACVFLGARGQPAATHVGTVGMWLENWAVGGIQVVVIESLYVPLLTFKECAVSSLAQECGYHITIVEVESSPEDRIQSGSTDHAMHRWFSTRNPWRRVDPKPKAWAFETLSSLEALAWFSHFCAQCNPIEYFNRHNTECDVSLLCDIYDESQSHGDLWCSLCEEHIVDSGAATCVACDCCWHYRCCGRDPVVMPDGRIGLTSFLCGTCDFSIATRGERRATECFTFGQILAGIGTFSQVLCELLQEGHKMRPTRNVYTVEIDAAALAYVLQLGTQKGYQLMTPEEMHTDFLNPTCDVATLPRVDLLVVTMLCNKHSRNHNGHADQELDMMDGTTKGLTNKCCALFRRKKSNYAAKFILMENVEQWLQSEAYERIRDAYTQGGYRVVLHWRCTNAELGVPEHRERVLLLLAHETQRVLQDELATYQTVLQRFVHQERMDSNIKIEDVLIGHSNPVNTPRRSRARWTADATLENCQVTPQEFERCSNLTQAEQIKVLACKQEIAERVGDRVHWYTGDLKNGGSSGQFPNLHKTEGRTPTITSSHAYRGIFCFNRNNERFFTIPELMILRGFSCTPILVACEEFAKRKGGWAHLGWLLGGAVTPAAYRVMMLVLLETAPAIMRPLPPSPPMDKVLQPAFTVDELHAASLLVRFAHKFLTLPGSEPFLKRDFVNPSVLCVNTESWTHLHTRDFTSNYTRIHTPSGVIHVFKCALQSQGVNTKSALMVAHSSSEHVKTNMAGKRGMAGVGFIAQPGTRNRLWDKGHNSAGNKIGQCHFKGQMRDALLDDAALRGQAQRKHAYLSYLHNVQHVCNATNAAIAQYLGSTTTSRLNCMQSSGLEQTASRLYPSVSIGLNPGVTVHLDAADKCEATWQLLGFGCAMGIPEVLTILHFQDGDACVFDSTSIWHCMLRVPPEMGLNANFSQYSNKKLHNIAMKAKRAPEKP